MKHTDTIEEKLKQSKKYRSLCTETIHRIALWAADRYKGKDAVKAAKNKLHQVFGSYWNVRDFRHMEKLISQAEEAPQTADVKPILLEIMRSHISSLERTEFMEDFYRDLF
ncbi:MAG: hypothetical protein GY765_28320, partial [bacterium]|nr:hypothetical protein [bacterium]